MIRSLSNTFSGFAAAVLLCASSSASAESMPFEIAATANLKLCQQFVGSVSLAADAQERKVTFNDSFSEVLSSTETLAEKVADYPELAQTDAGDKVLSCLTELYQVKSRFGL